MAVKPFSLNFRFPTGGLVRRYDLQHQPPYTTPWCQNVRPRDIFTAQERGGTRPGLGPAFYDQLGSGNPVNFLQAVELREDNPREQWPESFQYETGDMGTDWLPMTGLTGLTGRPRVQGIRNFAFAYYSDGLRATGHATFSNVDHDQDEEVELFIFPHRSLWWGTYYLYFFLDETTPGGDSNADGLPDEGIVAQLTLRGDSGDYECAITSFASGLVVYNDNGSGTTNYPQAGWFSLRITAAGQMELWWLGVKRANISHGITSPVGYGFGFGMKPGFPTWAEDLYGAGDTILPTTPTGFFYQTDSGGQSGSSEPTDWATELGDTTTDNLCTWTCKGKLDKARMQADLFRYQHNPLSPTAQPRTRFVAGCNGKVYIEADQFRRVGAGNVSGVKELSTGCTIAADRLLHGASFYQKLFIADYGDNKVKVTDAEITGKDGQIICSPTVLNFNGLSGFSTWPDDADVIEGVYVVPSVPTGFVYRCLNSGHTSTEPNEPDWPTSEGESVVDNTTSWICCRPRYVNPSDDLLTIFDADSAEVLGQYQIHYVYTGNATTWSSGSYSVGDRRSSSTFKELAFECSVAGTTGGTEPSWNTAIGGETVDGTVHWITLRSSFVWVYPALGGDYLGENCSIQIERCPKVLDFLPDSTAPVREDSTDYRLFSTVRPKRKNGLVFECTGEGTSDSSEPDMNVDVGDTVTDGGVTWTARKYLLNKYTATSGATPLGCPLIARHGGCIILAGNPGNVGYKSYLGDPFNWFFDQVVYDPARAMQLWPSEAGEIPESLTALISASDDYLLIGTRNTLWRLTGNPAAGATLQNLSREVGILSPTAWCFGPAGEVLFLSRLGLKIAPPGGAGYPQDISELRLPDELKNIDPAYFDILMGYDSHEGVANIYLSGRQPRATRHYALDWLGNSMWPDDLHGFIFPRALCRYTVEDAHDSCLLYGCYDGYLRRTRRTYENDEGRTLSEFVYYGPFMLGATPEMEGQIISIQATLDEESGPVSWTIYIAPTAEEVVRSDIFAQTPPLPACYRMYSGTWYAGPNYPRTLFLRGSFMALALTAYREVGSSYENTRAWAIQEINTVIQPLDRRRLP